MDQNGMRVEDFINAIIKRWKMILGIILVMGILGSILSGKTDEKKTEYTMDSKIYVDIEKLRTGELDTSENALVYYNKLNNIVESVKSRTLIQSILNEVNSEININDFYDNFWVTLQKDSQVIKFEVIGNNKEELFKIMNTIQNKAIEMTPIIIKNSESRVIEEISVVSEKDVSRTSVLLIMLVLGSLGSVMLAFVLEYLDDSIKNTEQVESNFKLSVIGNFDRIKDREKIELQYGIIRNNFKYSPLKNKKTVVVTSVDNKTNSDEIAIKLALSLSKVECKTLVINVDKESKNKGLIDVIAEKENISNVITNETGYLDSIELGDLKGNNIDILDSISMDNLLEDLKEKYEYIIINTKSLNNSVEAQILVAKADSTIIVAKINETQIKVIEKAIGLIRNLNTSIVGVILS